MKFAFVLSECESYAIMLFSALLKEKGHEVQVVFDPRLFFTDEISNDWLGRFFDIRKRNIEELKKLKPDYIGFSVYTQDYKWSVDFARMIKKEMDTPIIFGGVHPTLCPEAVLDSGVVDIICLGEGEGAILELAEGKKDIQNLWFKNGPRNSQRKLIENLDQLPFLDREIMYKIRPVFKKGYSISTGRGCPHQCTFCSSRAMGDKLGGLGKYVRQRSVGNVIEELYRAKRKWSPKNVYFTDDVFILNVKWLKEFAPLYKKFIGLPFYCTANPGTIKLEEISLLKEAGCQMIGFGLQSTNEKTRKELLKRVGTNDYIKSVARECKHNRLAFSFDHIFDLPGEPLANQEEAIDFYNETRPDVINTFTMTYLPHIELNKFLDDETRKKVNNGDVRTSMFIRSSDCYASVFSILPLLPCKFIDWLHKKGYTKKIKLPYILRLLFKDIKRLQIKRYSDIFFPIELLFNNIWDNLKRRFI